MVYFVHLSRGHSFNTCTVPKISATLSKQLYLNGYKKIVKNQVITYDVLLLPLFFDQSIVNFCCSFEDENLSYNSSKECIYE